MWLAEQVLMLVNIGAILGGALLWLLKLVMYLMLE
jgi:hypothetical protein